MPLCGSSRCGCALVSLATASGEISGVLPTIDVAGSGTPASPWNLTLNDEWVTKVADLLTNIKAAGVATAQSTSSTSYVDLTTVGPSVTCKTGTTAVVIFGAWVNNNTNAALAYFAVAVSGATTVAAADAKGVYYLEAQTGSGETASNVVLFTGLTPGNNTFTLKYRVSSGTGNFSDRTIAVIPLV